MPLKTRKESKELMILRSLNTRMELSADDQKYYLNLKKGYEGEVMFDQETVHLDQKFYILNDLLLKSDHSTFQVDSLFTTQKSLVPFEIKNLDGDYYYENGDFYLYSTGKKIKNPLTQLDRSENLLRELLQKHGLQLPVSGFVIFINPSFTLYQAPLNKKIIYPTQLNRLIKDLNSVPSKLNSHQSQIANFLLQSHITDSPFSQLPSYEYESLRKGSTCGICHSFSMEMDGKKIVCCDCGFEEKIDSAVVRNVEELKLLFPDVKITTNLVYEWCQVVDSKKVIRRILKNNYEVVGKVKYSHFI